MVQLALNELTRTGWLASCNKRKVFVRSVRESPNSVGKGTPLVYSRRACNSFTPHSLEK